MKINKQTNKNTQLQNKIKFKKKKKNRTFPLSHTHDKTKKKHLSFFYPAQNLPSFSFYIHFRQF